MIPPQFAGDPRHRYNFESPPDWFIRDMGVRLVTPHPRRRWRLPIWPGFRLELRILPASGAKHV